MAAAEPTPPLSALARAVVEAITAYMTVWNSDGPDHFAERRRLWKSVVAACAALDAATPKPDPVAEGFREAVEALSGLLDGSVKWSDAGEVANRLRTVLDARGAEGVK